MPLLYFMFHLRCLVYIQDKEYWQCYLQVDLLDTNTTKKAELWQLNIHFGAITQQAIIYISSHVLSPYIYFCLESTIPYR